MHSIRINGVQIGQRDIRDKHEKESRRYKQVCVYIVTESTKSSICKNILSLHYLILWTS